MMIVSTSAHLRARDRFEFDIGPWKIGNSEHSIFRDAKDKGKQEKLQRCMRAMIARSHRSWTNLSLLAPLLRASQEGLNMIPLSLPSAEPR
jgi:hypothetical protein